MMLGSTSTSTSTALVQHHCNNNIAFRPPLCSKNTKIGILTLGCSSNMLVCSNINTNAKDATIKPKVAKRFRFGKVYDDGQFEANYRTDKILPSLDPITGVQSRDVVISTSTSPPISARIFVPPNVDPNIKIPLLYYIHGGAFCMQSAFAPVYHDYLNSLVAEAEVIAVSIEYRLFQESPLPACYDDAWAGLQWVAAHIRGIGPDPLLNTCVDYEQLFVAGDSAGANMGHFVAVRATKVGLKISGLILAHPFFGGTNDEKMWLYMCPTSSGLDDPRLRPSLDDLANLSCERILVFKGGRDPLGIVADIYCEKLKKSGWKGSFEFVENKGRRHAFYFRDTKDEEALLIQNRICNFIDKEKLPDTRTKLVRYPDTQTKLVRYMFHPTQK